jgi:hypothetical protein
VILFMLSACQDGVVSSGNQLCCWRTSLGFPCSGAGGRDLVGRSLVLFGAV